jgi:hypothetical protein
MSRMRGKNMRRPSRMRWVFKWVGVTVSSLLLVMWIFSVWVGEYQIGRLRNTECTVLLMNHELCFVWGLPNSSSMSSRNGNDVHSYSWSLSSPFLLVAIPTAVLFWRDYRRIPAGHSHRQHLRHLPRMLGADIRYFILAAVCVILMFSIGIAAFVSMTNNVVLWMATDASQPTMQIVHAGSVLKLSKGWIELEHVHEVIDDPVSPFGGTKDYVVFYWRKSILCSAITTPRIPGDSYIYKSSTGVSLWFLLLLSMLLPLAIFRGPYRRYRRLMSGHCQKCGYNLTGNTSGICPECGERI